MQVGLERRIYSRLLKSFAYITERKEKKNKKEFVSVSGPTFHVNFARTTQRQKISFGGA